MAKIYKTPQLIAGAIYEKHVGSNYHTALCLSVARVSNRDRAIFHDAMDGVQPMLDGEEELANWRCISLPRKSKIDPETMTGECFSAPSGS
jgi:hypothetical protein